MKASTSFLSVVAIVWALLLIPDSTLVAADHGAKRKKTTTIVIHAIGGAACERAKVIWFGAKGSAKQWKAYFESKPDLSIHYIVDREGTVVADVPDDAIAFHARSANPYSVGIELVNNGDGRDPFPAAQVSSLVGLLREVMARYNLSPDAIKAHSDLDKEVMPCGDALLKRRVDPGPLLDLNVIRSQLRN